MPVDPALYRRDRLPLEIIRHAVWLYFRFNLSHRDVEELLAERGIQVIYEAIRLVQERRNEQAAIVFLHMCAQQPSVRRG